MTMLAPSPVASRRETRRRVRRDAILEVAARYFLDNGYAGTTMSGIAAALGGSKGTLWNHFPSKEELFAAVLDQITTAHRAHLSEILDPGNELVSTLRRVCLSQLKKLTSPDAIALYRLVMSEGGRYPEMSRIFFEKAPRHSRAQLAEFLSGAMDRGQLRRADPDNAARAFLSLSTSGCHQQMLLGVNVSPTPEQFDDDAAFAVEIFTRAYAPDQPGERQSASQDDGRGL